ncbi:MAG TPA: hypothetical protein PK257_02875 [Candidatus Woesebacteria bacterium]|nr:hypothetical protein [Candidatus Woesebacteria bacterium]
MSGSEKLRELHNFGYEYLRGPVTEDVLNVEITSGNCRLAVQDYFYTNYGIYLGKNEIVLPEAKNKGIFVENENKSVFLDNLKEGDIIYGEKIKTSTGKRVNLSEKRVNNENEWLTSLHMGVYLGVQPSEILSALSYNEMDIKKPVVWHSSFISKGTSLWSIDKFCEYYKLVFARRIIN